MFSKVTLTNTGEKASHDFERRTSARKKDSFSMAIFRLVLEAIFRANGIKTRGIYVNDKNVCLCRRCGVNNQGKKELKKRLVRQKRQSLWAKN